MTLKLLYRNVYHTAGGLRRGLAKATKRECLQVFSEATAPLVWPWLGTETVTSRGVIVFFEPAKGFKP
jgi:hypothetical protein